MHYVLLAANTAASLYLPNALAKFLTTTTYLPNDTALALVSLHPIWRKTHRVNQKNREVCTYEIMVRKYKTVPVNFGYYSFCYRWLNFFKSNIRKKYNEVPCPPPQVFIHFFIFLVRKLLCCVNFNLCN